MEQKIIQVGNSAGVIIPQTLRKQLGLKPGDKIIIEQDPTKRALIIHKASKKIKSSSITSEFLEWLKAFNKKYSLAPARL